MVRAIFLTGHYVAATVLVVLELVDWEDPVTHLIMALLTITAIRVLSADRAPRPIP